MVAGGKNNNNSASSHFCLLLKKPTSYWFCMLPEFSCISANKYKPLFSSGPLKQIAYCIYNSVYCFSQLIHLRCLFISVHWELPHPFFFYSFVIFHCINMPNLFNHASVVGYYRQYCPWSSLCLLLCMFRYIYPYDTFSKVELLG